MSRIFSARAAFAAVAALALSVCATPEELLAAAGYSKGFAIESEDQPFSMKIQGRVQTRYEFVAVDEDTDENAFSIPRARLTLSGKAYTDALSYKFQTDFGKGSVSLKDFFVDYAFEQGLRLRVGQWTRPFSRQQINSSGSLELVDRAITDKFFGAGRDIGIGLHNGFEKSPDFEFALGVFNGTGEKPEFSGDVEVDTTTGEGEVVKGSFSNVPDRAHPAVVLRLGINRGGIKGYSEADLEGGPLRYSLGLSGLVDFDGDEDDASSVLGEVDFAVKVEGFSASGAFYYASSQDGPEFSDQAFAASGLHLQAGYVVGGRYQPAVRYALISPDGGEDDRQEILGGFSVYFFEHGLKWQTDAGALVTDGTSGESTDLLARTQMQLSF